MPRAPSCINADGSLTFGGGTTTVTTTGGKYIYDEARDLTSSPKGVKADGDITISGGNLNICVTGVSDGSEGLESKATLNITGGLVIGVGTTSPEGGIDCDNSNSFKIDGGTWSSGTQAGTFTSSSTVTTVGSSMGGGFPGGKR